MKLFWIIFLITACHGMAQNLEVGQTYYFKNNLGEQISREKMKLNKDDELPIGASIVRHNQVRIVNIESDRVYFEYLIFNETDYKAEFELYNLTSAIDQTKKIFSMGVDDFERYTNFFYRTFRGFSYGAYTVPIRLRSSGGVFEFDSNLSLGTNLIARWGSRFKENRYVDLSFGIGITKVNLNQENSDLGLSGTDFEEVDVLSPAAFTMSFGILVSLGQNINIGGHLGWDRLSTADNKANWIYDKKPWFGIGIGFQFEDRSMNSYALQGQISE